MKTKTYDVWDGHRRKEIIKGIKAFNPIGWMYVFESLTEFKRWCKDNDFDPHIFTLKPFDNNDYYDESEY